MIAVDTNILIYAHRAELPKHTAASCALVALAPATCRLAAAHLHAAKLSRARLRISG